MAATATATLHLGGVTVPTPVPTTPDWDGGDGVGAAGDTEAGDGAAGVGDGVAGVGDGVGDAGSGYLPGARKSALASSRRKPASRPLKTQGGQARLTVWGAEEAAPPATPASAFPAFAPASGSTAGGLPRRMAISIGMTKQAM
jgi:hypothetical protein